MNYLTPVGSLDIIGLVYKMLDKVTVTWPVIAYFQIFFCKWTVEGLIHNSPIILRLWLLLVEFSFTETYGIVTSPSGYPTRPWVGCCSNWPVILMVDMKSACLDPGNKGRGGDQQIHAPAVTEIPLSGYLCIMDISCGWGLLNKLIDLTPSEKAMN